MIIHKSENPFHYQLYKMADTTGTVDLNFCRYSRKVVGGAFFSCFIVLLISFASLFVLEPLLATIMWVFSDYPFQTFFNPAWAIMIWITDFAIVFCAIIGVTGNGIKVGWKKINASEDGTPKEPGFIRTWIKSFHEKTCFQVDIRE